ncbi:MAG TPA: hypothetical protein VMV69_18555 [Pirellulales bacterium]|nr:hypothetical protein [Pirellulales bacterium]
MSNDEYYALVMGNELGAMPSSDLRKLAEDKHLMPTDSVRRGKEGQWVMASTFKGLFREPTPKPTPETKQPTKKQPLVGGIATLQPPRQEPSVVHPPMTVTVVQSPAVVPYGHCHSIEQPEPAMTPFETAGCRG